MEPVKTVVDKNTFSVKGLRWLLTDIKDNSPKTKIKFKLKIDGWQKHFYLISHVSESNVIILDDKRNELKFVFLDDVVQFSVHNHFGDIKAHNHYEILVKP